MAQLNDKARAEINAILDEHWPLDQEVTYIRPRTAPQDGNLLPPWVIALLLIAMCAVFGCLCALVVRLW